MSTNDPVFLALAAAASTIGAAIAAVAGFGIGSVLTPAFNLALDTRLAVAAVAIPHAVASVFRFVLLKGDIDRRLLVRFGLFSAAGGLTGALLHSVATSPALTMVFATLLIFAGLSGATGFSRRMRFGPRVEWIAGALSGFLGGLVGNQGGIRSAALLGSGLDRHAFVATATAVAVIVDAVRLPVYIFTTGPELRGLTRLIAISTLGVLLGTLLGNRVLKRIPENIFQRLVGVLILLLGLYMFSRR